MKLKLKDKVDPKGVAHYRIAGKGGFRKVVLGDATQEQLGHLQAIGHPFVVEDKK